MFKLQSSNNNPTLETIYEDEEIESITKNDLNKKYKDENEIEADKFFEKRTNFASIESIVERLSKNDPSSEIRNYIDNNFDFFLILTWFASDLKRKMEKKSTEDDTYKMRMFCILKNYLLILRQSYQTKSPTKRLDDMDPQLSNLLNLEPFDALQTLIDCCTFYLLEHSDDRTNFNQDLSYFRRGLIHINKVCMGDFRAILFDHNLGDRSFQKKSSSQEQHNKIQTKISNNRHDDSFKQYGNSSINNHNIPQKDDNRRFHPRYNEENYPNHNQRKLNYNENNYSNQHKSFNRRNDENYPNHSKTRLHYEENNQCKPYDERNQYKLDLNRRDDEGDQYKLGLNRQNNEGNQHRYDFTKRYH
uniref:Uncharacterized protein n=1 Tax=viral metagenome TaxID=1070528 RepID=A0A6C0LS58_9ZZZZ